VENTLPTTGRLAGIDYGTKRIGVAVSDRRQTLASPVENYQRNGEQAESRWFRQFTQREEIVGIVVGLPVHLDGGESAKSVEARAFAKWLQELTQLPVVFCDERYTSKQAEQILIEVDMPRKKRKQRLDMLAAQILLQGFLETRASGDRSMLPLDG
jgi:putative Holliday junction resolvase